MASKNVIGSVSKALDTSEFEWLINLSDEILETEGYLKSPRFSFSHGSWYCTMYPKGYKVSEYISLFLYKEETKYEINGHFSLEMILNGMQLKKWECQHTFKKDENGFGPFQFLLKSKVLDQWFKKPEACSQLTIKIKISNYDPPKEDTLLEKRKEAKFQEEISCLKEKLADAESSAARYCQAVAEMKEEIEALKKTNLEKQKQHDEIVEKYQTDKDALIPKLNTFYKMCHDFKQLLLSEESSDVTLQVQDQQFKAHRSILSARSSVFAAMFHHNMKEKATGIVNVGDCEPSSFPALLEFLYFCSTEKFSVQSVFHLYTSADKYDIENLKIECLDFIKKNLSIETFCETVRLALQHPESNLLDMAVEFFARNMKEIIVTVKWQAFLAENPIQCNELSIKALAHWKLQL